MISLLTLSFLLRADTAFAFDVTGPGDAFVIYLSTESGGALVDFGNGLAIFHGEKEWAFIDRKPGTIVVFDKSKEALYDAVSDFASACFPLWPDMSGPVFSHSALLELVDKSSKGTQAGEYVPQQSFKVRAYKPTTIPGVGEIAALTFKHPFIKGDLDFTIFKLVDPGNSGGYENLQGMIHPPKSNEFAWTVMPAQSNESLSGLAWRRREAPAAVLTKFDRDAYKKVESSIKPEPESIIQDKFLSRFLLFGRGGATGDKDAGSVARSSAGGGPSPYTSPRTGTRLSPDEASGGRMFSVTPRLHTSAPDSRLEQPRSPSNQGHPPKVAGIELRVRLDKFSFKQNEAIILDVCIVNNTDDMYVSVDDRFRRTWNFHVTVYDEDNEVIEYPGWQSASRIVQPSALDAFVLVKPRKYYGDPSAFVLRLKEPGKYKVEIGYRGGATEETIQKLGVPYYYAEFLEAKPLTLVVTE